MQQTFLLQGRSVSGQDIGRKVVQDAEILDFANSILGSETLLSIRSSVNDSGTGIGSSAYIKFDLSSFVIPEGFVVATAELIITVTSFSGPTASPLEGFRLFSTNNENWDESTVTFFQSPTPN